MHSDSISPITVNMPATQNATSKVLKSKAPIAPPATESTKAPVAVDPNRLYKIGLRNNIEHGLKGYISLTPEEKNTQMAKAQPQNINRKFSKYSNAFKRLKDGVQNTHTGKRVGAGEINSENPTQSLRKGAPNEVKRDGQISRSVESHNINKQQEAQENRIRKSSEQIRREKLDANKDTSRELSRKPNVDRLNRGRELPKPLENSGSRAKTPINRNLNVAIDGKDHIPTRGKEGTRLPNLEPAPDTNIPNRTTRSPRDTVQIPRMIDGKDHIPTRGKEGTRLPNLEPAPDTNIPNRTTRSPKDTVQIPNMLNGRAHISGSHKNGAPERTFNEGSRSTSLHSDRNLNRNINPNIAETNSKNLLRQIKEELADNTETAKNIPESSDRKPAKIELNANRVDTKAGTFSKLSNSIITTRNNSALAMNKFANSINGARFSSSQGDSIVVLSDSRDFGRFESIETTRQSTKESMNSSDSYSVITTNETTAKLPSAKNVGFKETVTFGMHSSAAGKTSSNLTYETQDPSTKLTHTTLDNETAIGVTRTTADKGKLSTNSQTLILSPRTSGSLKLPDIIIPKNDNTEEVKNAESKEKKEATEKLKKEEEKVVAKEQQLKEDSKSSSSSKKKDIAEDFKEWTGKDLAKGANTTYRKAITEYLRKNSEQQPVTSEESDAPEESVEKKTEDEVTTKSHIESKREKSEKSIKDSTPQTEADKKEVQKEELKQNQESRSKDEQFTKPADPKMQQAVNDAGSRTGIFSRQSQDHKSDENSLHKQEEERERLRFEKGDIRGKANEQMASYNFNSTRNNHLQQQHNEEMHFEQASYEEAGSKAKEQLAQNVKQDQNSALIAKHTAMHTEAQQQATNTPTMREMVKQEIATARNEYARASNDASINQSQTSTKVQSKMADNASRNVATTIESIIKKSSKDIWTGNEIATKLIYMLMKAGSEFTFEHSSRVIDLSVELAQELGIRDPEFLQQLTKGAMMHDIGEMELDLENAPPEVKQRLSNFLGEDLLKDEGFLHDIGKLKIPDEILYKTTRLTDEEFEIVKTHPIIGEKILKGIPGLAHVLPVVRHHHERWDGKGYPDGLKGEEIPYMARIVALCDSFDAMISDRPYRKGMSLEQALNEIEQNVGTQFDPLMAQTFLKMIRNKYA